jgi:hypothetical protein
VQSDPKKTIADIFARASDDASILDAVLKLASNRKYFDLDEILDILAQTTREKIADQRTRMLIFEILAPKTMPSIRAEMLKCITREEWPDDIARAAVLNVFLPWHLHDVWEVPPWMPSLDELRIIRDRASAQEIRDPNLRGLLLAKLRLHLKPDITPEEYYGLFTEIVDCALEAGPHTRLGQNEETFFARLDLTSDFEGFSPTQRDDLFNRIIVWTPKQSQYVWYRSSVFVNQLVRHLRDEAITYAVGQVNDDRENVGAIFAAVAPYANYRETKKILAHTTRETIPDSQTRVDIFTALLQPKPPCRRRTTPDIREDVLARTTREDMPEERDRATVLIEMIPEVDDPEYVVIRDRASRQEMPDPRIRGALLAALRSHPIADLKPNRDPQLADEILACAQEMLSSHDEATRHYGSQFFRNEVLSIFRKEEYHGKVLTAASQIPDEVTRAHTFYAIICEAKNALPKLEEKTLDKLEAAFRPHITRKAMPDGDARDLVFKALGFSEPGYVRAEETDFHLDPAEQADLTETMTSSPKRSGVADLLRKARRVRRWISEKCRRQP